MDNNYNFLRRKYNIADLKVLMTTYYLRTAQQAKQYISKYQWEDMEADSVIDLGMDFYRDRQKNMPLSNMELVEYIYTGSLFNRHLLKFNGCMLHSSAVEVDGYTYLFSADSGTGKSTHTGLWLKHFGDRARIINDDKPVIRMIDGHTFVYGTPWSGKTDLNVNERSKLGGIVFLQRDEQNWIKEIGVKEAIPLFFKQTIRKINKEENMDLVLTIMERILKENPLYLMGCNISDDAVITAYNKIRRV